MEIPIASVEQNEIIQQLSLNHNVVIDSVAGSGKTTCNLHIATYFSNMNILLLTYNSKLKIETRERVKRFNINNIEIHSYHSFCVKYYNHECFNDSTIFKIINNKNNPLREFNYDLIVLDEAQDISSLYYDLICKIYKDNAVSNAKICIFGDKNQSIFTFNGADQRFIEYGDELFNFNTYNWARCNLSVSFRITAEMSLFINKCLLHNDRIISHKTTGIKPRYIICDCFNSIRPFNEVKYYLDLGYKPSDIFILAPSIKSESTPIRKLENKIKIELPDVMVYVPTGDDEKLDEELLNGKIVFSTFHQTKGLERKVVIIFNFDSSYFEYYKQNANPCICTNELYVATTRGIDHLTLFHNSSKNFLRFIDKTNIAQYCYFEDKKLTIFGGGFNNKNNISTPVTDIIKHLPQSVIDYCYNQLDIIKNTKYQINKIDIPLRVKNNTTTESVCEITGIAIPSMFELKITNKMSIFEQLKLKDIDIQNLTVDQLLYIANCWNSYKNGFLFKICQISNYDWLEQNKLDECVNRLINLNISINSKFERKVELENIKELLNRKLVGYIDCVDIDNNIIYEFKCVQKLEKEHYLQLSVYMFMYELEKNKSIKIVIANKEKIVKEIQCDTEKLIEYKQNLNKKLNTYSIGDIVKYKISDKEEIGTVITIYKTTKKIQIENNYKKIKILKTDIISIEYHVEMGAIEKINSNLQILNNQLIDIDLKLDHYTKKTKCVLFNILTNEYVNIDCEFEKLSKMVEYLIHSKYVNDKHIPDEQFKKNNKIIWNKYYR
jgi:hypothetical protein